MRPFRVSDIVTGAPVSGAVVYFQEEAGQCCGETWGVRWVGTFLADENGLVRLPIKNSRGYSMIVSADGYYNLTWTKITEYIESTVHNSNYQEKYFDGVETEIALFPETSIAIHLLAGAGGPEAAYVIVQGCYFNGQTRLQCLEQPHPPKGLLGEVIDRYDYPYFTPIPAARDTTFTRPGIGDLSIQMEVRYLDQDHKLIKTQSAGDFLTPRNTETNIAIQLE